MKSFCCTIGILLLLCAQIPSIRAQDLPPVAQYRHHVIVLIDRSYSAQSTTNSDRGLINILNELDRLCFSNGAVQEGVSLLNPGKDKLTILPYGLRDYNRSFNNYFISNDPLFIKLSDRYTSGFFNRARELDYFKYNLYRNQFGYKSLAPTLALHEFRNNQTPFERTFIIMLDDGGNNAEGNGFNRDLESTSELNDAGFISKFGRNERNRIVNIQNQLFKGFDLEEFTKNAASSRRDNRNGASNQYYLRVYELKPELAGAGIRSVFDYLQKERSPLQRNASGDFTGRWNLNPADHLPDNIQPLQLTINYLSSRGDTLKAKAIDLTQDSLRPMYEYVNVPGEVRGLEVHLDLSFAYQNPHYQGTQLSSADYPSFHDEFTWSLEPQARFLFGMFPLTERLYAWVPRDTQAEAVAVYNQLLFGAFLLLLLLLLLRLFIRRKPNQPKANQFTLES